MRPKAGLFFSFFLLSRQWVGATYPTKGRSTWTNLTGRWADIQLHPSIRNRCCVWQAVGYPMKMTVGCFFLYTSHLRFGYSGYDSVTRNAAQDECLKRKIPDSVECSLHGAVKEKKRQTLQTALGAVPVLSVSLFDLLISRQEKLCFAL